MIDGIPSQRNTPRQASNRLDRLRLESPDFQVSDTSGYRNGIITTSGTIILGTNPGQSLEDYDRNDFRRGAEIIFDIDLPSGATVRHPRGLLYVISASYSPEQETVLLDVGCSLSMTKLLDDDDEIEALIDQVGTIPLDPAQRTFENLSSSIAAEAKVAWVDKYGVIQKTDYFLGDSFGSYAAGEFVSVRGVTALSVAPLAAAAAIPDEVELSYSYPQGTIAENNQDRVDTDVTTSNYFLRYPAITYKREPPSGGLQGNISLDIPPVTIPPIPKPVSGCGNTPQPPVYSPAQEVGGGNVGGNFSITIPVSCSQNYSTVATPIYVPARRVETRRSTYGGPAAQLSSTESYIVGPALEANSQYYADKYAYCVSTYANQCLPNGGCTLYGMNPISLGRQITTYEYGSANEVVRETTSTFRPTLAAAQPDDWRSGSNRGIPQNFNGSLSETAEYLHQVVIREYSVEDNANVSKTTTYTSTASRGGGVGAAIDAYQGIVTTETRRSTSNVTKDIRPDSLNAATTAVETDVTRVQMHGNVGGYEGTYGPYIVKEDVPVPLLFTSPTAVNDAVNVYGDYLARFIEGDSRGLVIAESLRQSIVTSWAPNTPFRYYDPNSEKLMAFRVDACSWGASQEGCVVLMNGIWVADLEGTVTVESNLIGNATPDMSGANDPTPPVHGGDEPSVVDDVVVDKRFNFHVSINMSLGVTMSPVGESGVRPVFEQRTDRVIEETVVWWCTARIVQPGALVTLELDGSIPLESVGQPIVDDTLIVADNIFGTSNDP